MVIRVPGAGRGGARLHSQHSGCRGKRTSKLEACLVYIVSSRTARATQKNGVLKIKPQFIYLFFNCVCVCVCVCVHLSAVVNSELEVPLVVVVHTRKIVNLS